MEMRVPAVKYGLYFSSDEYLVWERSQLYKSEYVGGKIISISGASPKHNKALSNIIGEIIFCKRKP